MLRGLRGGCSSKSNSATWDAPQVCSSLVWRGTFLSFCLKPTEAVVTRAQRLPERWGVARSRSACEVRPLEVRMSMGGPFYRGCAETRGPAAGVSARSADPRDAPKGRPGARPSAGTPAAGGALPHLCAKKGTAHTVPSVGLAISSGCRRCGWTSSRSGAARPSRPPWARSGCRSWPCSAPVPRPSGPCAVPGAARFQRTPS